MENLAIKVSIPDLLIHCTQGNKEVEVTAETLQESLNQLLQNWPLLKGHLYDEKGKLRPHVLIFHNEENIRWLDHLEIPVTAGDRITILQSVSGG